MAAFRKAVRFLRSFLCCSFQIRGGRRPAEERSAISLAAEAERADRAVRREQAQQRQRRERDQVELPEAGGDLLPQGRQDNWHGGWQGASWGWDSWQQRGGWTWQPPQGGWLSDSLRWQSQASLVPAGPKTTKR